MNNSWLAQAERMTEFQRSVQERFQEGGSILSVLLVIGAIVLVLVLVSAWSRRLERTPGDSANHGPQELFEAVMLRLKLDGAARSRLRTAARSAHLEHPTILLLSPSLFDQHVAAPPEANSATAPASKPGTPVRDPLDHQQTQALRRQLFGAA